MTSKKKNKRGSKPTGLKLQGMKGTFKRTYPGEDPHKAVIKDQGPDFEEVASEPTDEASKIKYPPPKKDPKFRRVWMQFIESISKRENFNIGHLNSLEILCDLYVECEDLRKFLRKQGRSYQASGRSGVVWKMFPEVGQLNTVQNQIKDYMRLLSLTLKGDVTGESGGEKENWE